MYIFILLFLFPAVAYGEVIIEGLYDNSSYIPDFTDAQHTHADVEEGGNTLVKPTISGTGFENMNHDHSATNSGGVLDPTDMAGTANRVYGTDATGEVIEITLAEGVPLVGGSANAAGSTTLEFTGPVNVDSAAKFQVAGEQFDYNDLKREDDILGNLFTGTAPATLNSSECNNHTYELSGDSVLPTLEDGMNCVFVAGGVADEVSPATGEDTYLNGALVGAGEKITPTATGDVVKFQYRSAGVWLAIDYGGNWTDSGAPGGGGTGCEAEPTCVAYWNMEGTGSSFGEDVTSNSFDLTNKGVVEETSTVKFGNKAGTYVETEQDALHTTDAALVAEATEFPFDSTVTDPIFTVVEWVYITSNTADRVLFSKYDTSDDQRTMKTYAGVGSDTDHWQLTIRHGYDDSGNTATAEYVHATDTLTENAWYCVAHGYDDSDAGNSNLPTAFLGVRDASFAVVGSDVQHTITEGVMDISSTAGLSIGSEENGAGYTGGLRGTIDDTLIFNKKLDTAEITAVCTSPIEFASF